MCYVCRQPITNGYSHFYDEGEEEKPGKQCPLYQPDDVDDDDLEDLSEDSLEEEEEECIECGGPCNCCGQLEDDGFDEEEEEEEEEVEEEEEEEDEDNEEDRHPCRQQ